MLGMRINDKLSLITHVEDLHKNYMHRSVSLYRSYAGHYSAQSSKSSNSNRILTVERTFFALGSFPETTQGHVTAYAIINGQ